MFENKYLVQIEGHDTKRFVRNLMKLHINLLKIHFKENVCQILVCEKDYKKLIELKTIYTLKLLKVYGPISILFEIRKKKFFFLFLLFGLAILFGLSQMIFEVEVIHTKKEIRDLISEELKSYGITPLHFQVSFDRKEQIRSEILKKHQDKLEWLEIEKEGTKYIIKVEERKLNPPEQQYPTQNIVAKKDGIITRIEAENGEIVVKKNDYVKKGDILITGVIKNKEEPKAMIAATGNVYAETWYKATITIPLTYHEEKLTGRSKKTIRLSFLGKDFSLFDFSPYKEKRREDTPILKHPLLPISLTYSLEKELEVIDKNYTKEEAIARANEMAKEKVLSMLDKNARIISQKDLKIIEENSKIIVEVFLKAEENITDYQPIVETDIKKLNPE